jgi:hypothetical protein
MAELCAELNRLANGGASYRSPAAAKDKGGAANEWAGSTGLSLVGALNLKNGTSGLDLGKVLNALAGTSGLGPAKAASLIAS